MNKVKLNKIYTDLKKQLRDPQNKNNVTERKQVLDELKNIKKEIRYSHINERSGVKETKPPKSQYEFNENIDRYRYFSLLNKLNNQYIKCNCNFNINDKVVTSDERTGFVEKIIVYPDKVTRNESGIYFILSQCKTDGTKAKKLMRKDRLDTLGFPLEDIKLCD